MQILLEDLLKVYSYPKSYDKQLLKEVVRELSCYLNSEKLNSKLILQHFLAQALYESGGLLKLTENLNYSVSGLKRVFPKYFKTQELLNKYARHPKMIANRVYANRLGNGNESSGDGWKYRGRGIFQLTGKLNYQKFAKWVGNDEPINNPDCLATPRYAVLSAIWFWESKKLSGLAEKDDIKSITKKINGGYNGLTDRTSIYNKLSKVILDILCRI